MDPSQTLRDAETLLRAGAAGCLAGYRAWRHGRGFEPPGGDPLALKLGRRLVAPASPVRTAGSCGWCHAMNAGAEHLCKECGYEAHVSRMDCRCLRCTRGDPEPITTEAVEAALVELRRRHGAGVTGGPAPPSRPKGQAPGGPSCLRPREQTMIRNEPTPAQVEAAQARHPGMLLLFHVSDSYRAYGDHALLVGNLLGDAVKVDAATGSTPACASLGAVQLERSLGRLLRAGHRVALCDQVGE